MKTVTIKIQTENESFGHYYTEVCAEVARILEGLAEKIRYGGEPEKLLDVNGNTVGTVKYQ